MEISVIRWRATIHADCIWATSMTTTLPVDVVTRQTILAGQSRDVAIFNPAQATFGADPGRAPRSKPKMVDPASPKAFGGGHEWYRSDEQYRWAGTRTGPRQATVQDSGIGLDPDTQKKIFDSFYTTKPGGMGMGLSISRSILQAHGGRLWAAANDGPGTAFHFTIPKHREEESNGPV